MLAIVSAACAGCSLDALGTAPADGPGGASSTSAGPTSSGASTGGGAGGTGPSSVSASSGETTGPGGGAAGSGGEGGDGGAGGGPLAECGNGVIEGDEECDGLAVKSPGMMCEACKEVQPKTCTGAPIFLTLGGAPVVIDDVTSTSTNDFGTSVGNGGCGGGSAPDLVYRVAAGDAGKLVASVSGNFWIALSARAACPGSDDASQNVCKNSSSGSVFIERPMAKDQVAYVIVDGVNNPGTHGTFKLTLSLVASQ